MGFFKPADDADESDEGETTADQGSGLDSEDDGAAAELTGGDGADDGADPGVGEEPPPDF